jgi:hypothetical protein
MRLTVKQPLPFWAGLRATPFSGEQVAGSSVTLTEDSHSIERITGATLVESYVVNWTVLHPKEDYAYSAAYESSDEGVATVDANGTLTVVADGETTISVTVTRDFDGEFIVNSVPLEVDITAGSSIDYLETLDGSAGKSFVTGLGS